MKPVGHYTEESNVESTSPFLRIWILVASVKPVPVIVIVAPAEGIEEGVTDEIETATRGAGAGVGVTTTGDVTVTEAAGAAGTDSVTTLD